MIPPPHDVFIAVPREKKESMIEREIELIDEIIRTDEELSPEKPPKCKLVLESGLFLSFLTVPLQGQCSPKYTCYRS